MRLHTSRFLILSTALLICFSQTAYALLVHQTTEELVANAQHIIQGKVLDVESGVGSKPGDIDTRIILEVRENIKGQAPEVIKLTIPGGYIGQSFMFITDHPAFRIGQEAILYLDADMKRIIGQIQGKLTIENGMIAEKDISATDYVDSIYNILSDLPPVADLDARFLPVSNIADYLNEGAKYGYDGMHWDGHAVSIYINENASDTTGEGAAIQAAMDTWTSVPANFTFNYAGTHSHTDVTQNYKNEAFWSWDVEGDAIAYAAIYGYGDTIAECDLAFLQSYAWSAQGNPGGNEMDVQNIATHELGHFLMLLDLYGGGDSDKTMYGYAGPGETNKRSLEQDDKNGIIHIYGAGAGDDDDDDDDSDDDTPPPDDDDDTPPPDDDGTTDDDGPTDDDDSGSDDDNPFDEGEITDCAQLMELTYDGCSFEFTQDGSPIPGADAFEMCKADYGPWDCIFSCANNKKVEGCTDYRSCLNDACDTIIKVNDSSDDGGGGGSACGLFF